MNPKLLEQCSIIGKKGFEALRGKTVSIIGLGGVGTTLAQILARNGINLRVVDKDRIYDSEMPRMTVYTNEDINKFKAKQMKKRLEDMSGEKVKIRTFHEDLNENNVFLLDADMIIDVSNNMETSSLVNKFAIEKEIPLLYCNYSGRKGNIILIDKKQAKGPCFECMKKDLEMPSFKEVGVFSPLTTFLAGLTSSMIIKNLLGEENEHDLHQINIIKTRITHKKVVADKKCPVCKGK